MPTSKQRRTPASREAPASYGRPWNVSGAAGWLKFESCRRRTQSTGRGVTLTDDVLRRALVRLLERQGMPKARAALAGRAIDNRLALARAGINHMELTAGQTRRTAALIAMAIGVETFWNRSRSSGVPLSELFTDVAATLGPGLAQASLRLIAWALPRMANPRSDRHRGAQ
jgi:hypothetical protein